MQVPVPPGFVPAPRELALFAEFPRLRDRVPWMPLAHGPTPVEPCDAIAPYLGRSGVFVKRDDKVSPLYGGNKIRRFEFLFADAKARGATHIVTAGGLASTQVIATVLFGGALGFEVAAALFDQPVTRFARHAVLLEAAAGAAIAYGGGYLGTVLAAWKSWRDAKRAGRPYFIMLGASSPLATLGYVDAMLEFGEQVRRGEAPKPDVIVLPCGSGGTAAGLAVGAAILGWDIEIIGVRITELIATNRFTMRARIGGTTRLLRERAGGLPRHEPRGVRVRLDGRFLGKGYGHATSEGIAAIPEVERLTGVPGEVTYSGKALAGLKRIASERPKATILYWHTLSSVEPKLAAPDPATLPSGFGAMFRGDVEV